MRGARCGSARMQVSSLRFACDENATQKTPTLPSGELPRAPFTNTVKGCGTRHRCRAGDKLRVVVFFAAPHAPFTNNVKGCGTRHRCRAGDEHRVVGFQLWVFSLTEYRAKGDASWAAQVFSETSGRQYYFPNKRIEVF